MITFYIDMDDVVADWKGYARSFFKHDLPKGERLPESEWSRLKEDQRMYGKLTLKEGANELIEWVSNYADQTGGHVFFLSAIPRGNDMPWAPYDKVLWAQRYFPRIPVFLGPYSHEKVARCTGPNTILIDDRTSNINQWIEAGGRGHVYKNWPDCEIWLNNELSGIIK